MLLPFLDLSRTDEKDNNPLRCVNSSPSSLLVLSDEKFNKELSLYNNATEMQGCFNKSRHFT